MYFIRIFCSYLVLLFLWPNFSNVYTWKIDLTKKGILNHQQLVQSLENAVQQNPKTTFIACHLANCVYDLEILGKMLDKFPNLYADIAARYEETATIPRYVNAFYKISK